MKRFRFFLMFLLFMGEFLYANLNQSEVSSLYVAIFNRASEGEGNRFWQGFKPTLEETANAMLNTQDAIEYFGDSLDSNQAFIEHIYKNTLNKTYSEDPEGIKYWTKRLDSGESRGKIVADMVYIIKQYANTKDPLAKRAYKQFMNRVEVSDYTADTIEEVPENYKQVLGFDGDLKVTDDFKSAEEAISKIKTLSSQTDIKYNLSFDVEVQEGGNIFVKNISLITKNGNQEQDIESWEWTLYNNKTGKSIDSNTADSRQKEYITDLDAGEYKIVLKVKLSNGKEVENFKIFQVINGNYLSLPLKKSAQIKSYDENGNEVADGSLKDDGYYQAGVTPNYTRDDSTGIVTDHITGLMWQDDKEVGTVKKPWLSSENYKKCEEGDNSACYNIMNGDTATTYCLNLKLGGYDDWRLPTRKELLGIVDYGRYRPAIDPIFKHSSLSYYWSSILVPFQGKAWIIHFGEGYQYDGHSYKSIDSHFVRCVRDDK